MKISVAVSKGTGKMECEDNVLVGDIIINDTTGEYVFSESTVICVADGVGGNKGGREASEFLLRAVANENLFNIDEIQNNCLKGIRSIYKWFLKHEIAYIIAKYRIICSK